MQSLSLATVLLVASQAMLPAPSEYTMEQFVQDLHEARMVAMVEVLQVDSGSGVHAEFATLRVLQTFKGGLARGESTLVVKRDLDMVGWYEPDYRVGEESFLCISDTWRDGVSAAANTRGKFDIARAPGDTVDHVEPPPVGLGFSSEFDYSTSLSAFTSLLSQTLREHEFLGVAPLLPRTGVPLVFATAIDLSGGATLDHVSVQAYQSTNRVTMELIYTPCTGVCPYLYLVKDTSATLDSLSSGTWTATRHKYNSMINAPFVPADDSVQFTVYAQTQAVRPETARSIGRTADTMGRLSGLVDLRGRRAPGAAAGVRFVRATARPVVCLYRR